MTLTDAASVSIAGNLDLTDLVTTAEDYTITFTGANNTVDNAVDFINTGLVTLGDAGANTFTFVGGLAFSGGAANSLGADIITEGTVANFGSGGFS